MRATSAVLDADLIALAPFDVLDPGLQVWQEGLVDLLARALDGAGPLRTVAPTIVVRHWRGRADPASVLALCRATGAGLAVYGRRGQPCHRCGTPIRMARHGDLARSTYWCPSCQPDRSGA